MSQPEFVDNRNGNTLAAALIGRLEHLAATLRTPVDVAIATGYFNPEGFGILSGALEQAGHVRLLLGAEPTPPPARPIRHLGDPLGERFEAKLTADALQLNEQGLLRDRDRLDFAPGTDRAVRQLLAFLESGRIEVRRYTRQFLHGKAYLFSAGNGVIAGSSNFTASGLVHNLELNLGQYQPAVAQQVERWFEDLWSEAEPYDLAAIYAARFAEYEPYLIYLRVLWERYGSELEAEATTTGRIHLTRFQTDGLDRARRILERYHGVLIADSVGLGKTFLAGELLTDTLIRKRQRALLVAPAALRDGTWRTFASRFLLTGLEVKSFEEVARGNLDAEPDEYSLIVVDEAHAYRHADTVRAGALRDLLRGDPPKQVVLMTATPVNNSLWDLYQLLSYFVQHDSVFADIGIRSLKDRFDLAAEQDPYTLKPDVLFDVLDATTVRRTRHFVQRFYPNDRIELKDGTRVTIQFPRPHVRSVTYDLDAVLPGFFEEFTEILQPEDTEPRLSLARYWPTRFRMGGKPDSREVALVGLIRSGLLKRFESSVRALATTLERMVSAHDQFLAAIDAGVIPAPNTLTELEEADTDEAWETLLAEGIALAGTDFDVPRLRDAVQSDRALLSRLYDRVTAVTPRTDPKLPLLVNELIRALKEAEAGVGEQDVRNRRKVLIFSYFADTVEWIAAYLEGKLAADKRLAAYRGRLAVVRGTEGYEGVGRQHAIFGFAPDSTEAPPGQDEDRFDILITTDVIAEGMNLQQCARIINYDLPWNPMRLVQRHGRIDRIGSPHADVFISCIFPDRHLDELLALEERIRRKLAQAAASIGLDSEVIPGAATAEHVFADTREELERIREGNARLFETAGEDVHAHSGEEYRQELRKGIERYGDRIRKLPGAAGSGLRQGRERGHFFCARVDDRVVLRFVPWEPSAPVRRDALGCLRTITCAPDTPRDLPPELAAGAYGAWDRARADIFDEWQRAADPRNLQPDIRPLFRAAAEHVRRHRPPEMTLEAADRLVEILEAPRLLRIERALREAFTPEAADGVATTRALATRVKELGLQPWKAPEPLPPIDSDDIVLVVWMAVEAAR